MKAEGDLLTELLGESALVMAKENAVKSASSDDDDNLHHQRVLVYVREKLGMHCALDYATRLLRDN